MNYIDVADLRIGDIIEEDPYGDRYEVLTNPYQDYRLWSSDTKCLETGRLVTFSGSKEHSAYAPRIFLVSRND